MTSGAHDDGELGEVFLKLGKQGSTLAGVMDAFSIAVSIGLQYGVPLETYVSKFTNLRFEPAGLTDDPDVRMAQSIMDYIFRRLALDYLSFEARSAPRHLLRRGAPAPPRDRLLRAARRGAPAGRVRSSADVEPVEAEPSSRTTPSRRSRPRTPTAPRPARSRPRPRQGGPHLRRAPREDHRHRRRLPALHDLRHQDAPRRLAATCARAAGAPAAAADGKHRKLRCPATAGRRDSACGWVCRGPSVTCYCGGDGDCVKKSVGIACSSRQVMAIGRSPCG